MKTITHITAAHPWQPMVGILEESALKNGFKFIHLPRHWSINEFGKIGKVYALLAYLQSGLVDNDEVIIFTDAYDVVIARHSSLAYEKFRSMNCGIVFGTEANFFPNVGRENKQFEFEACNSKWRYLNSGGFIGYAQEIRAMLIWIKEKIDTGDIDYIVPDDQALVQNYFLELRKTNPSVAKLDTRCEIFCSLNSSVDDYAYDRGALVNIPHGTAPCVLHLNGEKGDLPILTRFHRLNVEADKAARIIDIRTLSSVSGGELSYSRERGQFLVGDQSNTEPALLLIKAGLSTLPFLLSDLQYLTFKPNLSMTHDTKMIKSWELLRLIGGKLYTHHESSIVDYVHGRPDDVMVGPLPLRYLRDERLDHLIGRVGGMLASF